MISSYIFRYYILYVRDPSIKSLVFVALCLSIPSFIHMAAWIRSYDPNEAFVVPDSFGLASSHLILGGHIVYRSTITLILQLFITSVLVLIAYAWIRNTLLSFAIKMGSDKNDVKNLNARLVKVINFHPISISLNKNISRLSISKCFFQPSSFWDSSYLQQCSVVILL